MIKKRILIVDDEAASARLLKQNLEQTDAYEVRVENWAENAVATARKFKPDLVLLDILMPRMFGGDVAAAMRACQELQHTPIVFLTATVGRQRVAEHEGIINRNSVIAKPASAAEIAQCIEQNLNHVPQKYPYENRV